MPASSVHVGDEAPYFRLQNEKSEWMTLHELTDKGPVILVFYPGDFRMVCTKQLCSYQDAMNDFKKLGVQLVGISANPPEEHLRFKERYNFEFPLLTDTSRLVSKAYGVVSLLLMGGISRSAFIVSPKGRVLYRYVEPTPLSRRRPDELLKVVSELKSKNQF